MTSLLTLQRQRERQQQTGSALADLVGRSEELIAAIQDEFQVGIDRAELMSQLVNSLVGKPNHLTGKPHSASSAHDAAKETEEYRGIQQKAMQAECATMRARTLYEVARVLAWATVRDV